jgi:hypothetical protein
MVFNVTRTDCGSEPAESYVVPKTSDPTRPKAEPEEVKFDIRILAFAISVFAVDNFGFRRMHLQVALRQPGLKLGLKSLCFLLAATVN